MGGSMRAATGGAGARRRRPNSSAATANPAAAAIASHSQDSGVPTGVRALPGMLAGVGGATGNGSAGAVSVSGEAVPKVAAAVVGPDAAVVLETGAAEVPAEVPVDRASREGAERGGSASVVGAVGPASAVGGGTGRVTVVVGAGLGRVRTGASGSTGPWVRASGVAGAGGSWKSLASCAAAGTAAQRASAGRLKTRRRMGGRAGRDERRSVNLP